MNSKKKAKLNGTRIDPPFVDKRTALRQQGLGKRLAKKLALDLTSRPRGRPRIHPPQPEK